MGVELPVPEIEQESESLKGIHADKDLDSKNTAATNFKPKVLENNGRLQLLNLYLELVTGCSLTCFIWCSHKLLVAYTFLCVNI